MRLVQKEWPTDRLVFSKTVCKTMTQSGTTGLRNIFVYYPNFSACKYVSKLLPHPEKPFGYAGGNLRSVQPHVPVRPSQLAQQNLLI